MIKGYVFCFKCILSEVEGRFIMAWTDFVPSLPSFSWTTKEPVLKTVEGFLSSWLSPVFNWVWEGARSNPFISGVTAFIGAIIGGYLWNRSAKAQAKEDAKTMRKLTEFKDALPNFNQRLNTLGTKLDELSESFEGVSEGLRDTRTATNTNTGALTTLSARIGEIGTAVLNGFQSLTNDRGNGAIDDIGRRVRNI